MNYNNELKKVPKTDRVETLNAWEPRAGTTSPLDNLAIIRNLIHAMCNFIPGFRAAHHHHHGHFSWSRER